MRVLPNVAHHPAAAALGPEDPEAPEHHRETIRSFAGARFSLIFPEDLAFWPMDWKQE
jgi:hypothetical protein